MKREHKYKVIEKQVWYFNGQQWLVKETFNTAKKAKDFLIELDAQTN